MAVLPAELERERVRILKNAENYGLDMFETVFEIIDYRQITEIAAFGGFPVRYPHWRFGMEYESLSKGQEYGLSHIYEMVINNDPCYAYLLEGNSTVDQKLVMAHVFGHCDFFKNNQWFAKTNRKMMDNMANHATRVRRYIDRHGLENVETFIDRCLSLDNLIDRYNINYNTPPRLKTSTQKSPHRPTFKTGKDYMDEYINRDSIFTIPETEETDAESRSSADWADERDVLKYLLFNAPLTSWQQDILSIIREEAYYFAPQGMTKIMNEGWATYWHSTIMTKNALADGELIDYADRHSGVVAMSPGNFNPYTVGLELFKDIETRWNKGQFGREWEDCQDLQEKQYWDKKLERGRQKIFEVRRSHNDITFIDEFLTEDFCVRNKMFVYKFNRRTGRFEIDTREFTKIKRQLLFQLTNFGQPIVQVVSGNYENRGELLIVHLYEGVEMQPNFMVETLKNVQAIWKRPVNLATVMDQEKRMYRFDGREMSDAAISDLPKGA